MAQHHPVVVEDEISAYLEDHGWRQPGDRDRPLRRHPRHQSKLDQAGIYTPEPVREVARLWINRKGDNALSAAISPAQNEFARRYAAALEADDPTSPLR